MAIIPSSTQFIGIAASVNLTEKKSSQLNSETQPYTMQDIIDTAGGGGTPAGTAGQIQFSDGSAFAADSNLFWDNTNKRLGIGTSSPSNTTHIRTSQGVNNGLLITSPNACGIRITGDAYPNELNIYKSNAQFTIDAGGFLDIRASADLTIQKPTIKGSGSTSATTALLVQNSSGTTALEVLDDSRVKLGNSADLTVYSGSGITSRFSMNVGSTSLSTSSAILQVTSTTQGFLPPRGSNAQMLAIVSPAEGLIFYDNTNHKLNVFDGTSWVAMH